MNEIRVMKDMVICSGDVDKIFEGIGGGHER